MDAIYSMKVKLEEYYQLLFFSTLKEIRRNRTRLLEIGFHRGKGAFACLKGIYIYRERRKSKDFFVAPIKLTTAIERHRWH